MILVMVILVPSDGLHMNFPKYTYDDMVLANYKLLTEHLNKSFTFSNGTSMADAILGLGIYLS
jgi:homoserine acetyltransferase